MGNSEKFLDVYPNYDISTLPKRVRENIDNVRVEGKTKRTLILPDGQKYFLGNKLNHLTGSEWTYFTNSVINTNFSTAGGGDAYKIRKIHPSPKPPALLKDIILFFTKEGDLVFDYFAGVGGTLLASSMCGRKCIGIELNELFVEAYYKANDELKLEKQTMICGDSSEILRSEELKKEFSDKKAKLILIDPPYGNMMAKEKTGDDIHRYGKTGTPFTKLENDLGNMSDDLFWDSFVNIVNNSLDYLENNGYLVVFIKDMQPKGKETNLLHLKMIETLNRIECLYYKGLKIWADQTAKLFPYGYPFEFVATQIHQYILIFKKEIKRLK